MNTLPEWFTVEAAQKYRVEESDSDATRTHTGKELHEGVNVTLSAGAEKHFAIRQGNGK